MKKTTAITTLLLGTSLLLGACSSDTAEKADTKTATTQDQTETTTQSPANDAALQAEIDQYHQYVIDQCDQFVQSVEAFTQAVKNGEIDKAKSLYAPSRMYFERIEPIAESLGDFDPWIDARENDVPEAEWRGFHRLEKALWVDNTTEGQTEYADQLLQDVKLLRAKVETVEIDAPMLVTGAVELLNEVSSSKVTGEEERYSHTDLYDFAANVEGAKKIFDVIRPTLEEKDADLAKEIDSRFADLNAALDPYRKGDGYLIYTELTQEQTKGLSQAIDALAEPLSRMGTVLEG
ncbi:MAG TPA: iron uptake system protein EfeO [Bacilli bacterium]|nr:iron uptake system protein EfeO [Bacilli bacterium]